MSEEQVKRPRHLVEIERLDEQTRVADLSATAAAHEALELLLDGPSLPRGLVLEGAERAKVALSVGYPFHCGGTHSADQLVLQIRDANEETQPFHLGASELGAEAGALEAAPELAFLCGVTEARQSEVEALRAVQIQEPSDGLRAPDRYDGNALSVEVTATALGERFDRAPVADAFDEHDRSQVDASERMRPRNKSTPTAGGAFAAYQALPFVHSPYLHSSEASRRGRLEQSGQAHEPPG